MHRESGPANAGPLVFARAAGIISGRFLVSRMARSLRNMGVRFFVASALHQFTEISRNVHALGFCIQHCTKRRKHLKVKIMRLLYN